MEPYIAYCGPIYIKCPVYLVTKPGDERQKAELARKYLTEECQFEPGDMNGIAPKESDNRLRLEGLKRERKKKITAGSGTAEQK